MSLSLESGTLTGTIAGSGWYPGCGNLAFLTGGDRSATGEDLELGEESLDLRVSVRQLEGDAALAVENLSASLGNLDLSNSCTGIVQRIWRKSTDTYTKSFKGGRRATSTGGVLGNILEKQTLRKIQS